jgi:mRNA interferase MazF
MDIRKGDLFYADLGIGVGSEQSGVRPVLVIQNDIGNKYSPTVIVASITTQEKKLNQPTHVLINEDCGLKQVSIVMLEQIRTVDKSRLQEKIGRLSKSSMRLINKAIDNSFFLTDKE